MHKPKKNTCVFLVFGLHKLKTQKQLEENQRKPNNTSRKPKNQSSLPKPAKVFGFWFFWFSRYFCFLFFVCGVLVSLFEEEVPLDSVQQCARFFSQSCLQCQKPLANRADHSTAGAGVATFCSASLPHHFLITCLLHRHYFITSSSLPHHFLITPHHFCITSSLLHHFRITSASLPHHFLITCLLHRHYFITSSSLPHHFLITSSSPPHCFVSASSLLPHDLFTSCSEYG